MWKQGSGKQNKLPLLHTLADRQKYFKSSLEIKLVMSPQAVQSHIVGVGSLLYLDLDHPAIPDDMKKELRFVKHVGNDVPVPVHSDQGLYGTHLHRFTARCENHTAFHAVLACMLLYEMPESVVPHSDFCDIELQVWVGVRQVTSFKNKPKFSSRYLTVPTKTLVSLEKMTTAGMSLAIFESCLK